MMPSRTLNRLSCLGVVILFLACVLFTAYAVVFQAGKATFGWRTHSFQEFWFGLGFESFMLCWSFVVGSSIASFLNVVAYRLPLGLRVTGTSFCPQCKTSISQFDNVPVFGWLMLGGRCKNCQLPISPTYPINEAIGGLIAMSVYFMTIVGHGFNLPGLRDRTLPFGISIHFDLLDPNYIYIAIIHTFLIYWLFASHLVRMNGGRLPVWIWSIGFLVTFIVYRIWPNLYVVGFDHATSLAVLVRESISQRKVAMSLVMGAIVGFVVGWSSRSMGRCLSQVNQQSKENVVDVTRDWILSWVFIGIVLGWQAVLIVSAFVAVGALLPRMIRKYGSLWLAALLFILAWRWLDRSIIRMGSYQQFLAYGLMTMVSMLVFAFESWRNRKPLT
jgi:leader peptidase (prepilin peptidase) / N-methyltransferase